MPCAEVPYVDEWWLVARRAIDTARAVVFVASRASLASLPCWMERTYVLLTEKPVVNVLLDRTAQDELSVDLATVANVKADGLSGDDLATFLAHAWPPSFDNKWAPHTSTTREVIDPVALDTSVRHRDGYRCGRRDEMAAWFSRTMERAREPEVDAGGHFGRSKAHRYEALRSIQRPLSSVQPQHHC
jgi:hypothetical protein